MRKLGLVMVTGELLEKLLAPLFLGGVPKGLVILKVVASESCTYGFNVIYTSTEDGVLDAAEGAVIPQGVPWAGETIH